MFLDDAERTEISQTEYEKLAMWWLTATRSLVAAKTIQRRLTTLRQFARWAGWDEVSFDDYSAPTPLRGDPHPLPEGIDGVKRMLMACRTETEAALVSLCGLCGLRVAEALNVRPSDFDLEEMILYVHGKGSKERIVPVSTLAWKVLNKPVTRAYLRSNDAVVPLKDRAARAAVSQIAKRANLRRHVASHDLRATFATEVYNKTKDQRLVQKLLGHANGSTTEIYIERTRDQMREGVEL